MVKEKINEITVVEKFLIVLSVLLIVFYLYVEYKYLANHIVGAFFFLITPLIFISIILLRFSIENKAKISLIFGVIGLIFLITNLFDRYTSLNIYLGLPIQMMSIFGLIYGIIGLTSKKRGLAITGIIFNLLQFITLLIPRYQY